MNNIDDLIKEFEEKAKTAKSKYKYDKDNDEIYDVDIHIWRHKGMGNSLQTISGNKISIMTATCSFLTTLCIKNVITLDELKDMLKLIEGVVEDEQ
jgi:hypothetical protein